MTLMRLLRTSKLYFYMAGKTEREEIYADRNEKDTERGKHHTKKREKE